VGKIPFCYGFNRAFLLVLIKPNVLQTLLNIKAVISLLIKMLCLPGYKLLLCILCLGHNLYDSLAKKLNQTVFERLLSGVLSPDRNKALGERLQISSFKAPDIGHLFFYLVYQIV
jgi:hypothetical protein